MEMTRVSVLLPHRLGLLTYAAAAPLPPGTLVRAPLASRELLGVVWDDPADDALPSAKLKPVRAADTPIALSGELRRFVDFCARYTLTPRGALLHMVLRGGSGIAPPRPTIAIAHTGREPDRWTEPRRRVVAALCDGPLPRPALLASAGVSAGVLSPLLAAGVLEEVEQEERPPAASPARAELTEAQTEAADALATLAAEGFAPVLLEGVTGSGKTEVYADAVARTVAAGAQALVLMPEIALTPMVIDRLAARLGRAPGAWHSSRSAAARNALWHGLATGTEGVVVGARSALFLPFRRLGLIVVDEEHDVSYKQDDGVLYHARDMAIARAREANAPVVLATATPSIETVQNVTRGRYRHLSLPSRFGGAPLPTIEAIDLRREEVEKGAWLSDPVRAAVSATLAQNRQALLFLNRRGYAPLTVCRRCGHRLTCPNCSASLVEHRLRGRRMCHHCGHHEAINTTCPACNGEGTLAPCGPGVERVAEEAHALWPHARLATVSSDAAGPTAETLTAIANHEVDIIVGTQLVAKGFTFPALQLVVVVDADLGLDNADPRAAERTFQLLTQVAGRAGRVEAGGRALLQTHAPEHPVMAAMIKADPAAFTEVETGVRREAALPPFTRFAALIVSATSREEAFAHGAALARLAPGSPLEVLGPAEAPLAVLRGRHRVRFLVRAPRSAPLQETLSAWVAQVPVTGTVRRAVDIDPQTFL